MRLPSKSEGPKCLKYQNVPYKRNFWHIVKPWERFQRWVRLIYFLTVPDEHIVSWIIFNLVEVCKEWVGEPDYVVATAIGAK